MAGRSRNPRRRGRAALVGLGVLLGAVGCGSDGDEAGNLTTSTVPGTDATVGAGTTAGMGTTAGSATTAGTGATVLTGTAPADTVTFRPMLDEVPPTMDGTPPSIPLDRLGPAVLDGNDVVTATAVELPGGDWVVSLELAGGPGGIQAFNAIAEDCVERRPTCPAGQIAIVVDDEVVTAPEIQTGTFEADAIQISGAGNRADAEALAARIAAASHGS